MDVNPEPDLASPPTDDSNHTEVLHSDAKILQREDQNPVMSKLLFTCLSRDPLLKGETLI